jgi:hypothetical protein
MPPFAPLGALLLCSGCGPARREGWLPPVSVARFGGSSKGERELSDRPGTFPRRLAEWCMGRSAHFRHDRFKRRARRQTGWPLRPANELLGMPYRRRRLRSETARRSNPHLGCSWPCLFLRLRDTGEFTKGCVVAGTRMRQHNGRTRTYRGRCAGAKCAGPPSPCLT